MAIGMSDRYLENLCDEIDAAIFTGDKLSIKKNRDMLSDFIGRWTRAIEKEDMQTTESPGDEPTCDEANSVEECQAIILENGGLEGHWYCTLPAGHDGPHIAGGPDGKEYYRWPNEGNF